MKNETLGAILVLFALISAIGNASAQSLDSAVIYYNKMCGGCTVYIDNELIPQLNELGVSDITKKDYVNLRENRAGLNDRSRELGVPPKLQGHFTTFIGDRIILQGHIPEHILIELFKRENQETFERIVVFQDEMGDLHDASKTYKVWAYKGDIKEYPLNTPVTQYLNWFGQNKENLKTPLQLQTTSWSGKAFLSLILVTGFLDGLNPCAFAVLLFFIAFLFTIKKTKGNILKMGIIYISAIYLAYFLIGIGLFKAIMIFDSHHAMAKIGAWLVIALGGINLAGYFIPNFPIKLKIPALAKSTIEKWAFRATNPSAFILGFLVGLCTFPCSGGPYVAIIGLLAAKKTYLQGLGYLVLYNLMFVMPLVIVLALASSKKTTDRLTRWERSDARYLHLLSGIVMVLVGVVILVWFV